MLMHDVVEGSGMSLKSNHIATEVFARPPVTRIGTEKLQDVVQP